MCRSFCDSAEGCCATTADCQEVQGRSPNAATAESTDLVADALAQMAMVPEKALVEWQGEQQGRLYTRMGRGVSQNHGQKI